MDINKIINDIAINQYKGNNSLFAKDLDTSEANIRNYRADRIPKLDFIIKLFKKFEISFDKMFLTQNNDTNTDYESSFEAPENLSIVAEPLISYRKTKDPIIHTQRIPLYDLHATAGLQSVINGNSRSVQVLDYLSIPGLPSCDGSVYAKGDSMYPLIKSGDIVAFKGQSVENIFYGEMYLIGLNIDDWEDLITIKFIQKSDISDHIKLVSQNTHHSPKDIHIKHIKGLALIRASIRLH